MPELEAIECFQEAFIELLTSTQSLEQKMDQLRRDSRFEIYRDQVSRWEPRMIETASRLVAKWARSLPDVQDKAEGL
jgi:hypothetical protein